MNNKLLLALAAVFLMQLVIGALAWRAGGVYALGKISEAMQEEIRTGGVGAECFDPWRRREEIAP